MFSPEEQQIEICLLKSNLEKIEDDLIVQNSALPALDAENEQKYRDTMTALRIARSLNAEKERLDQENVRLTAKRMQLKQQCQDITTALERARGKRSELVDLLKSEEQEMELQIRNYESSLKEKAHRFRTTSNYYNSSAPRVRLSGYKSSLLPLELSYTVRDIRDLTSFLEPLNETAMNNEVEELNNTLTELQNDMNNRQSVVNELKSQLDALHPDVPENILDLIGKYQLEEKLKVVKMKLETLSDQRKNILNSHQ
ncbi:uncharacterized protein ACR2FA_000922 [Aphomia sociella]